LGVFGEWVFDADEVWMKSMLYLLAAILTTASPDNDVVISSVRMNKEHQFLVHELSTQCLFTQDVKSVGILFNLNGPLGVPNTDTLKLEGIGPTEVKMQSQVFPSVNYDEKIKIAERNNQILYVGLLKLNNKKYVYYLSLNYFGIDTNRYSFSDPAGLTKSNLELFNIKDTKKVPFFGYILKNPKVKPQFISECQSLSLDRSFEKVAS
jgi:hypothetical protein